MSYKTNYQYTVRDGQREFDIAVPFLERSHMEIKVNGLLEPFVWVGSNRIRLINQAPDGSIINMKRVTPIDGPLVVFNNGATLTAEDQNRSIQQVLFRQQETSDIITGALDKALVRVGDRLGITTDPDKIAEELLMVSELGEDLVNRFRAALYDLDRNGLSLADHTIKLTNQAFRMDTLQGVVDALANLEDGTGLATIIQNEAQERLDGDTALAETMALIGAKSPDGLTFILDMNKVKTGPAETLASRFNAIYAANDTALGLIQSETNARVAGDSAITSSLATLGAKVGDNTSAIAAESIARANAISAEASSRQALASTVGQNQSFAENAINTLSTNVGSLTTSMNLLGAKNGASNAFVLDMNKVQVGGGQSLATRMSGIDTRLGDNAAAVVAEQTARVNADSALSQSLSTVQNTVNGHTGSISSLTQVTNGINLKHSVALNSNGHITGFIQNNNGSWGSFNVVADEFGVTAPNGGTPVKVFQIVAGKVRFNANVEIAGNLLVSGTINHSKLTNDTVTGVFAAYNSNTINLNNHTPTRIHGHWINVEKASSPIDIDFNCWATFVHNAGGSFTATVQLVRSRGETGGTMISSFNINGSGMANDTWQGAIPVRYLDKPNEAGSWHYYVQIFFSSGMTTQSVTARYGKLTELKNNTSSLSGGTGSGNGVGSGGYTGGGGGGGGDPIDPPPPWGGGGGGLEQPVIP
ncbi:phage tail fiber protein [Brevundimonas sp. BH3]|uniref:phage tail fiber domain-containing protein n=1 Tax=Brevundimonas sp. BH3 TaxID=3133089 RepID=UPI0032515824